MTRKTQGRRGRFCNESGNESGLSKEAGQSLVEYMILLALVVLVCVGTTKALGSKLHSKFREIRDQIDEGVPVRLNP